MHAIPAIEAAKFYPEVPKLFWQNQDLERDGYEGVIYRVHPQATSADVERALRFIHSAKKPSADTADALNHLLTNIDYPSAQVLLELKDKHVDLPAAVALLHFFRPAFPLYRPESVNALAAMGFAVSYREDLTEDGVGAYEGYIAAIDLLKRQIPFAYVPETNVFLSRLIEAALHKRGL